MFEQGCLGDLEYVDFSGNELGPEICAALLQHLQKHCPKLRTLIFSENEIGSKSPHCFTGALKFPSLETIDLGDNEMNSKCEKSLGEFFAANPQIQTVKLDGNDFEKDCLLFVTLGQKLRGGADS